MTKSDLENESQQVYFVKGGCHAIVVRERVADEYYPNKEKGKRLTPLVEIWVGDDENWFYLCSFDAGWLPALIKAMQAAENEIIVEWPEHGPLKDVVK